MNNNLRYKVTFHANKRKKKQKRNVTMKQEREKGNKEDRVNEKRQKITEGKAKPKKMEKAKQLRNSVVNRKIKTVRKKRKIEQEKEK